MNCKFCGELMADDQLICPACGKENTVEPAVEEEIAEVETVAAEEETLAVEEAVSEVEETEQPAAPKKKITLKAIIAICCCGALLLGLVAAVFFGMGGTGAAADDTVKAKESYSVTDEQAQAAANKVVATLGDAKLTNGQFQIFYWGQIFDFLSENSYYLSYMGLDYTKPLDQQYYSEADGLTWQHYFIDSALSAWNRYQLLDMMADKEGFVLSTELQTYLDTLEESLKQMADAYKIDSVEELIQGDFGGGASLAAYHHYLDLYYHGYEYFLQEFEKLNPTYDEVEAYYDEHYADFEEQGITVEAGNLVDVRHILIQPEGCDFDDYGYVVATDDQWEACRQEAQALLDNWVKGEATEDAFAALANAHSADGGSNTNGGLYTEVMQGDMVEAFDAWCFDESRKEGDTGLVKTEFGYHIMYYVRGEAMWYTYAKSTLISEIMNERITAFSEDYEMEVNYKNIALAVVDLAG